jgi:hypothetical protein
LSAYIFLYLREEVFIPCSRHLLIVFLLIRLEFEVVRVLFPHLWLLQLFLLDDQSDLGYLTEQMLLVRAHLEVIGKGSGFVRSTD